MSEKIAVTPTIPRTREVPRPKDVRGDERRAQPLPPSYGDGEGLASSGCPPVVLRCTHERQYPGA